MIGLGAEGGAGAGRDDLSRNAATALSLEARRLSLGVKRALNAFMTCVLVNKSSWGFVKKLWAVLAAEGGSVVDMPVLGPIGLAVAVAVMEAKERPFLPPITDQPWPSPGGGVSRSKTPPVPWYQAAGAGGDDSVNPEIFEPEAVVASEEMEIGSEARVQVG